MRRGLFITLEGGEGVGKSTLLNALVERAANAGRNVVATREPGGTPLAEKVRDLVLHPPEGRSWTPLGEALLMNAARADHLDRVIRPALERGDWVICDRFADSTRVYQGARAEGEAHLRSLAALEHEVVADTWPDLTLILDAPPEAVLERRRGRGGPDDAFESRDPAFHAAVRSAFLAIARAEPERCRVIDALGAPEAVAEAAWTLILQRAGELETT